MSAISLIMCLSNFVAPEPAGTDPAPSRVTHEERLAELLTCDESGGTTPCKIGEIIIEGSDAPEVEVWK